MNYDLFYFIFFLILFICLLIFHALIIFETARAVRHTKIPLPKAWKVLIVLNSLFAILSFFFVLFR